MSEHDPVRLPSGTARDSILAAAMPSASRFLPGAVFGVLSAASAIALLAVSAWLLTRAAEQPALMYLSAAVVGVRAFALGRAAFRYLERLASHDAAFGALADVRVGLYRRLAPVAPTGAGDLRRGQLLSRLVSDADSLQDLPLRVTQPLVISGVVVTGAIVGVSLVSPAAAAALAAAVLVAVIAGTVLDGAIARKSDEMTADVRGDVAELSMELVRNTALLTAYDALPARVDAIARADARLRAAALRRATASGVVSGLVGILGGIAVVAAFVVAQPALASQALAAPSFVVLVLVPLAVFEVVGAVPLAAGAWRRVHDAARRIATVAPDRVPTEIPIDGVGAEFERAEGGTFLRIRGLAARWPGSRQLDLAGVTVSVAPGECLLVTGDSGAGKSTLAAVLARFLEYDGSVTINGSELRDLEPASVRRVIGLCEQRPHIFDDSIRHNLIFARDSATDAELWQVLARVGLDDWAAARGGLDAPVGERGGLVSGGQAQRIAVARALLADFPVLILDEPTANVDPAAAGQLLRDVLGAVAGTRRSVILVSHLEVPGLLVTNTLQVTPPREAAAQPESG